MVVAPTMATIAAVTVNTLRLAKYIVHANNYVLIKNISYSCNTYLHQLESILIVNQRTFINFIVTEQLIFTHKYIEIRGNFCRFTRR